MIGVAVKCKEDMEILNLNVKFEKGTFYTFVEDDDQKIWVISRNHEPIKILDKNIFKRHFKIKN
jgi:hypothetical protein